ncbi:MAG: GtrA family protein [Paludibacter sp.]
MNVILEKSNKLVTSNILAKFIVFFKAQISAFVGGITDYSIMIFFTEFFHVHYTISIVIGGVIGAVVNFSLNNKWTFHSKDIPYKNSMRAQLFRFILVALNSIFLKSTGTFAITTYLMIDYKISRLITDLFVSIGINYTLQRYWVFKKA